MTPSPLLVAEATSSLSEPLAAALLIWIAAVVLARMTVLVERLSLDWALATLAMSFWFTALLRDRAVQSVLTRWIALADIRLATHAAALCAAGALVWIGLLWHARRPVRDSTIVLIWVGVAVLVIALAAISAPARAANIAVEELSGWRPGVYLMTYSLPTALAELLPLVTAVSLVWHWRQSLARAVFAGVIIACIAVSQLDAWTRILTGWMITAGQDELTIDRAGTNDLLFLAPVALLMLLALPSIATSLAIRLRRDPASRNIAILEPMWADMMDARPEMRLHVKARKTLPQVTEHRMLIEIEDTMISAAPYLAGLDPRPDPSQVCQALRAALDEGEEGYRDQDACAPAWVGNEAFVLKIAREWSKTRLVPAPVTEPHLREATV
ncbi:DUF6545 domain-containing protein [Nocardia sp. XZ_19_385]|uniref:DUF6545 domain-containing protein n=1 Tax=Nocardia sp. XZ_19_385 TaxID=2769488 RepID=UPI00188FDA4B|nr:DUF6545 domain-containing protein [Nocardia sp. XZ_19_385]